MKFIFVLTFLVSLSAQAGKISVTVRPEVGNSFGEMVQARTQIKELEGSLEHHNLMRSLVQKSLESSGCRDLAISSVRYTIYGTVSLVVNSQNCTEPQKLTDIRGVAIYCLEGSLVDWSSSDKNYSLSLTRDVLLPIKKICRK